MYTHGRAVVDPSKLYGFVPPDESTRRRLRWVTRAFLSLLACIACVHGEKAYAEATFVSADGRTYKLNSGSW